MGTPAPPPPAQRGGVQFSRILPLYYRKHALTLIPTTTVRFPNVDASGYEVAVVRALRFRTHGNAIVPSALHSSTTGRLPTPETTCFRKKLWWRAFRNMLSKLGTFSEFSRKWAPRNDSALCAKQKRFTVYNRATRTCSPTRGIPPESISRRSRKTSQRLMQCSASARGSHGSSSCCQHDRPSPSSSPSILQTIFSLQPA